MHRDRIAVDLPAGLAIAQAEIRAAVKAQPDATLQELCEAVEKETKIKSNPAMMYRELVRLKLPRKKSPSMPASFENKSTSWM